MSTGVTLTAVDNLDGSGTITIGGTPDDATNRLYRANWSAQPEQMLWLDAGTRIGDGTLIVSGVGDWLWRLESYGDTVLTAHCYGPIIDPAADVYQRMFAAIRTRIQGLGLSGISPNNVVVRWEPKLVPNQDEPPMIVIGFAGGESYPATKPELDDIGIPFVVAFYEPTNVDPVPTRRATFWRWRTLSALRWHRLAGCPEGLWVQPETGLTINPAAFEGGRLHSYLGFRLLTRTQRG